MKWNETYSASREAASPSTSSFPTWDSGEGVGEAPDGLALLSFLVLRSARPSDLVSLLDSVLRTKASSPCPYSLEVLILQWT